MLKIFDENFQSTLRLEGNYKLEKKVILQSRAQIKNSTDKTKSMFNIFIIKQER